MLTERSVEPWQQEREWVCLGDASSHAVEGMEVERKWQVTVIRDFLLQRDEGTSLPIILVCSLPEPISSMLLVSWAGLCFLYGNRTLFEEWGLLGKDRMHLMKIVFADRVANLVKSLNSVCLVWNHMSCRSYSGDQSLWVSGSWRENTQEKEGGTSLCKKSVWLGSAEVLLLKQMCNRVTKRKRKSVQSQSCDIAGMTGTWWNSLHSWSAAVDGHGLNKQAWKKNGRLEVHRGYSGCAEHRKSPDDRPAKSLSSWLEERPTKRILW